MLDQAVCNRQLVINSTRRNFLLRLTAMGGGCYAGKATAETTRPWPLFSVEAKGSRLYLMGQIPPRPSPWHDPRIEALVPRCSAVWTETNNIYRKDVQELIARYGVDETRPLESRLAERDRERVAKAAELAHLPLASLAHFRPFLAASILEDAYYKATGMSDTAEQVLIAKAMATGVSVSSEFPAKDDVIVWFGAMSPEQDIQFLRYSLDQILDGPENERIYAAWSRGDAAPAASRVAEMKRLYPDLYPKIVIERNSGWIPRFRTMLASKRPALVITGLYHLAGPDNLLVQVRAAGLTVRAI
jgi:uncharacterized protein YbaP (TraB family)